MFVLEDLLRFNEIGDIAMAINPSVMDYGVVHIDAFPGNQEVMNIVIEHAAHEPLDHFELEGIG